MQRRHPFTTRPAVVLAALICLAASACGAENASDTASGQMDVSSAAAAVQQAAQQSAEVDTIGTELVMTLDGDVITSSRFLGTVDGTMGTGTVDVPPFGVVDMLAVDSAYYYAFPDLPDGKQWVRVGFEEIAASSGIDPGASATQDPTATFEILTKASDDVVLVGTEDIDGTPTNHYTLSVRADELLDRARATGVLTESGAAAAEAFGDTTEMDVWVDADGWIRRQRFSMSAEGLPGATSGTFGYEIEFFDHDVPVDVQAPDPATVMTMAELTQPGEVFVPAGDVLE